jgi:hypothetical protein
MSKPTFIKIRDGWLALDAIESITSEYGGVTIRTKSGVEHIVEEATIKALLGSADLIDAE